MDRRGIAVPGRFRRQSGEPWKSLPIHFVMLVEQRNAVEFVENDEDDRNRILGEGGTIQQFFTRLLDLLSQSEAAGFDSAWINEHHFHAFGGMMPCPAVALAAIAARTTRIRLGTSIAITPLHNPIETAEIYAMLDQVSGGRLEFGVGSGYLKHDYDVLGVSWAEGHERLFESLQVVVQAWQHQPFSFHGKYYNYDDVSVWRVVDLADALAFAAQSCPARTRPL